MIEKRTVFILGAGASCPYGFPTARGLREEILSSFEDRYSEFLDGFDDAIPRALHMDTYPDMLTVKSLLDRFRLSSTDSIDLFLSRNPQFARVGKIAVCLSILHAEKRSVFREKVEKREHDWYFRLFGNPTREATTKEEYHRFGDNHISFITFNYDRSLEQFLFEGLLNSFEGTDEHRARELLARIPVIHVYGRPAPLPWELGDKPEGLPYGDSEFATFNLLDAVDNIHVVHEERENPELERARDEIAKAERIFFLGFGYAKENLDALGIPGVLKAHHQVYGTALDAVEKEIKDIEQIFLGGLTHAVNSNLFAYKQIHILNCDCAHLLRQFL
jgi:hypothetical protein